MRVVMYGRINPSAWNQPVITDTTLAIKASQGETDKGLELCDRLHARGENPSVSRLVKLACPGKPTVKTFDRLADVVTTWQEIHREEGPDGCARP